MSAPAQPGQSEGTTARDAFLNGLLRPSVTSVAVAIGVLVATFLAYCVVFGPAFTGSDLYRYQMTSPLDSQTYVTHKVLAREHSGDGGIVITGTSTTMRCIAGEEVLSDLVAQKSGIRLPTNNLTTDAQATWEMAALTEHVSPAPGGVLVLGLTVGNMSLDPRGTARSSLASVMKWPKVGFTSKALDEEARRFGIKVPFRTGIYAIDNAGFLISRRQTMLKALLRGGAEWGEPLNADWIAHVNRPEFWAEEIASINDFIPEYEANSTTNFEVLERLIARARQDGDFSIIIFESPINPAWWDEPVGGPFYARYRADLAAFADRIGAELFRATDEAGLVRSDFVDYEGHLGNADARQRCTEALASSISKALEKRK